MSDSGSITRIEADFRFLGQYEAELDPQHPELGQSPTKVLGYGEMSTTLAIGGDGDRRLAYKRMPMFETRDEAAHYEAVYWEYVEILQERLGIQVVSSNMVTVADEERDRVVIYLVQEMLPSDAIGNQVIRRASKSDAELLLLALLGQMANVFRYNESNSDGVERGFDGQISNWAIFGFEPEQRDWQEGVELVYFDTGSPLLRKNGQEQISPEMYLRSAPSFLTWILRLFFLEDVVERYYDFRQVIIDLLANLYKEGRPDLVPALMVTANTFLDDEYAGNFRLIRESEVSGYYRQDAWIWRLYLGFRRIDAWLHRVRGKYYPYVLPGKIRR